LYFPPNLIRRPKRRFYVRLMTMNSPRACQLFCCFWICHSEWRADNIPFDVEPELPTALLQQSIETVPTPNRVVHTHSQQRQVVIDAVASFPEDTSDPFNTTHAVRETTSDIREPSNRTKAAVGTPANLMDSAKNVSFESVDWFTTNSSTWTGDMFPKENITPLNRGWGFFESGYKPEWLVLCISVVGLCLLDILVMQRLPNTFGWHLCSVFFWLLAGAGYDVFVWWYRDSGAGVYWIIGYVLEWMLSMDNLFVFHLVFTTYKTPPAQIHKAVFVGIIGAVLMRLVFFMALASLLHLFDWIRFLFGAFLIWSGIEAAREGDDDEEVSDTKIVSGLKWLLGKRLLEDYDKKGAIFVHDENGRLQVTVLFVVIWILEVTDIIFAVDSVSAKISQIPQEYIASSSVLAMFGLRATFFIVQDLVHMFDLLKYGLCIILIFIGLELMFSQWLKLQSSTVCLLILVVFFSSIALSTLKGCCKTKEDEV